MRILIITNHFYPENFRINDLASWLKSKGNEVIVFTGIPDYPEGRFYQGYGFVRRRRETWQGVKVVRFPLIPRRSGSSLNLAIHYISSALCACLLAPLYFRESYDCIFVFETSPITIGLPAVVLKKLKKIPIIFWILDLWPDSLSATGAVRSPFLLRQVRRLTSFIYRNCDEILVSSKGFIGSVKNTGGYLGEIEYFPNWIEPEYEVMSVRKDIELPVLPKGFRILFAGNIGAAQDFETILSAAELLKNHHDIHWIIVGDGRRAGWVRDQIALRSLGSNFHLLGKFSAETMPTFFQEADALLVTLRRDPIFALTVPGKIQSYLACGRPIIAALDGEGAQLIEDSGGGVSCRAEDPKALAAAVLRLYRMNADELMLMGRRGREFGINNFSREMLFSKLEERMYAITKKAD